MCSHRHFVCIKKTRSQNLIPNKIISPYRFPFLHLCCSKHPVSKHYQYICFFNYFTHINWLQERFPEAKYEDVTGLCKLATLEEVREQDYSLNPGRYVGVVIEEDGKTEEEFVEEILGLNEELETLNKEAAELEKIIAKNIARITGG